MVSTKELIFRIQDDYAKGVSVDKLLVYLDSVQRKMFLNNSVRSIYLNGSDPTFPYPILETQEGVLEYEITTDSFVDSLGNPITVSVDGITLDVAEVVEVFRNGEYHTYSDYGRTTYGRQTSRTKKVFGKDFDVVPVRIQPRTFTSPPKITFQSDPKTKSPDNGSTDVYFVEVSVTPRKLTSIEIPLSVDTDKWEDMLIDGVVGEIQKVLYGESKVAQKFETEWLPRFRGACNKALNDWEPIEITRRTI